MNFRFVAAGNFGRLGAWMIFVWHEHWRKQYRIYSCVLFCTDYSIHNKPTSFLAGRIISVNQ